MFAVIEMGGKQYRVTTDQILYVEKTGTAAGEEISVDKVLLVEKDGGVKVGAPVLSDVTIKAKVLADVRAPKILGFKYKRRKNYRRKWGHRQDMQQIQITSINA